MRKSLAPWRTMPAYEVFQAAEACLSDLQEGRARLQENVVKRIMATKTVPHPKGYKRVEAEALVAKHCRALAYYGNHQETIATWLRNQARRALLDKCDTMLLTDDDYRVVRDYLGRKVKPWAKRTGA